MHGGRSHLLADVDPGEALEMRNAERRECLVEVNVEPVYTDVQVRSCAQEGEFVSHNRFPKRMSNVMID